MLSDVRVRCKGNRQLDGRAGEPDEFAQIARLHLAIASRTYLRAFDMWVEEHPRFRGRAERSDSMLEEHQSLVEATLNHVLAEERLFGLDAGEQAWLRRTT